ncbi:MAG TPA: MBL fold metallo-hydrolase [Cellulomonas sp.]
MRILVVVALVFGTNAYLVTADDGSCVVVDPGGGAAPAVHRAVAEHGLRVTGVLATHGHADHVWDAAAVADEAGVPLRLHARDAERLADPLGALAATGAVGGVATALVDALRAVGLDPEAFGLPAAVEPFGDVTDVTDATEVTEARRTPDVELVLGGVRLVARHAPGHTAGSTLYLLEADGERVALTGDVLFAGSVGRTDLPGGDTAEMARTLREVVAVLPAGTHVLPGHGPATRLDAELATNPYLAG